MNFVALSMLMGDRLKYLGLLVGVAFSAMLITQQAGILVGLASQTGSFIRDTSQGDLWVMDDQVRFSQDTLPLQDTTLTRVRGIEGVAWAVPMYQQFLRARLSDGTRMTCILVGLDDATLTGGPPEMARGALADLRRDRAVIVDDAALATKMALRRAGEGSRTDMRVGDRFDINDSEVEVVGTYKASRSFFWEPVVYTTYSRAIRMAPQERRVMTYVIVKLQPGADAAAVSHRIKQATGLTARTNGDFMKLTADYILKETGILVNFGMAVALGFFIGVLMCGQMLYNFTIDALRYYGSLKAMGATNLTLVRMVLVQVLSVGAIGYGIGVGLASFLGKIVGDSGLAFSLPWQIPVLTGIAILTICGVAGLLSLWRVLRLEPAIVFKA
jgi:putative ABC transport system permease protein